MQVRHLRTCIVCKTVTMQDHMTRLVYHKGTDTVIIDVQKDIHGRGAYVCSPECLKRATEQNIIHRNLRVQQKTPLHLT